MFSGGSFAGTSFAGLERFPAIITHELALTQGQVVGWPIAAPQSGTAGLIGGIGFAFQVEPPLAYSVIKTVTRRLPALGASQSVTRGPTAVSRRRSLTASQTLTRGPRQITQRARAFTQTQTTTRAERQAITLRLSQAQGFRPRDQYGMATTFGGGGFGFQIAPGAPRLAIAKILRVSQAQTVRLLAASGGFRFTQVEHVVLRRVASRKLAVAQTAAVRIVKQIARTVTAHQAAIAKRVAALTRRRSLTANQTVRMARTPTRKLTGAQTQTVRIAKQTTRIMTAHQAMLVKRATALTRRSSLATGQTVRTGRTPSRRLGLTASMVIAVTRRTTRAKTLSAAQAAALSRRVTRIKALQQPSTAHLVRQLAEAYHLTHAQILHVQHHQSRAQACSQGQSPALGHRLLSRQARLTQQQALVRTRRLTAARSLTESQTVVCSRTHGIPNHALTATQTESVVRRSSLARRVLLHQLDTPVLRKTAVLSRKANSPVHATRRVKVSKTLGRAQTMQPRLLVVRRHLHQVFENQTVTRLPTRLVHVFHSSQPFRVQRNMALSPISAQLTSHQTVRVKLTATQVRDVIITGRADLANSFTSDAATFTFIADAVPAVLVDSTESTWSPRSDIALAHPLTVGG